MPCYLMCWNKRPKTARFCGKCGRQVATDKPSRQARAMEKGLSLMLIIILIVTVAAAVIVSVLVFVPLYPVNFNHTNEVNQPNLDELNLNFQADVAEVNVVAQNLTGRTILINTSVTGFKDILGSSNPVQVTFSNETVGDTLTVTSKVANIDQGLFSGAFDVTCNIYINPSLNLNLNITTETGQISLTANQLATFESLNLKSTTGMVQANIENSTMSGNMSLKTTTGAIFFRMNQVNVQGNDTLNLQSTTGLIETNIMENQTLSGNVQVNAATTTGAVNLAILINGDIGARIESQTKVGEITTNLSNFSGNKSQIQSINYPAESNFIINLKTSVGGIGINAQYQSSNISITRS